MGFKFPLSSVLTYRRNVERREELALEQVHMEINSVQRAADQLTLFIEEAHRARESAMQQSLPACHLHTMLNEMNAARQRKDTLLAELQALEQRRDQQLNVYHTAHRDRRMLSDMADRQKQIWQQDRDRAQQRVLDDTFGSRRRRQ